MNTADNACAEYGRRPDQRVLLKPVAEKTQHHQHHGSRIDGIQEWNGELQKTIQTHDGEHTTADSKQGDQRLVGKPGDGCEELRTAAQQSHTGCQTGKHINHRQKNDTASSKHMLHKECQNRSTIFCTFIQACTCLSGISQHRIHQCQKDAGNHTGFHGVPDNLILIHDAFAHDIDGNDAAEVQCRKGIHGVVSVQESLDAGMFCIEGRRFHGYRRNLHNAIDRKHHHQHQ